MKLQFESLESRRLLTARCIDINGEPDRVGDYNADTLTTADDFHQANADGVPACARYTRQRAVPVMGDVTGDDLFNADDLIEIFAAGKYGEPGNWLEPSADWYQGDFDFDGRFDSDDMIEALSWGAYEARKTETQLIFERSRLRAYVMHGEKDFAELEAFMERYDMIWGDEDLNGVIDHDIYEPKNEGEPGRSYWSSNFNKHGEQWGALPGDVNADGYANVADLKLVYGDDVDPDDFRDDFWREFFGPDSTR